MDETMRQRVERTRTDTTLCGSDEDRAFALRMRDVAPSEWMRRMERLWTDRLMAKGVDRFPADVRVALCGVWKTIKELAHLAEGNG